MWEMMMIIDGRKQKASLCFGPFVRQKKKSEGVTFVILKTQQ